MKPLTKNMWRAIKNSLGRFIAIVLIIMLGVLIFCRRESFRTQLK
ncbi:hypothetical protein OENI_20029 [Oenococcus oeni]|nr:hypothetical protein OENI_20029 [Oenococcus oeni]